jgi:two-component system, chemotaxis family, chemotaxis protein CheY
MEAHTMPKILSVDDSKLIRTIVGGVVDVLGYDFLGAEDADQALDILDANWADVVLIVLDVNMPGMNGFELLEKLKSNERYKSIPVMMVTTESERSGIIRAVKAGAANYLCKPFAPEELAVRMQESLGCGLE